MKLVFEAHKLKLVAWTIVGIIGLGYLAILDMLLINMYQEQITINMKRMTNFVELFFISGLFLRLIKSKKIILPFIVIGDATLIFIMIYYGGLTLNSLWEIFLEPGNLLNITVIIILIWDWRIRNKRISIKLYKRENTGHNTA